MIYAQDLYGIYTVKNVKYIVPEAEAKSIMTETLSAACGVSGVIIDQLSGGGSPVYDEQRHFTTLSMKLVDERCFVAAHDDHIIEAPVIALQQQLET